MKESIIVYVVKDSKKVLRPLKGLWPAGDIWEKASQIEIEKYMQKNKEDTVVKAEIIELN